MKFTRLFLAALPLIFMASAAPDHVAIGSLHFGVTQMSAMSQMRNLSQALHLQKIDGLTAAVLRKEFLYVGSKTPGTLAAKDAATALRIDLRYNPNKLNAVEFRDRAEHIAGDWDGSIKDFWLQLRDVCESKFARAANSTPGEWPAMDSLPLNTFTPTDTWEFEGIKIELGLITLPPSVANNGGPKAAVLLRATNTLTK